MGGSVDAAFCCRCCSDLSIQLRYLKSLETLSPRRQIIVSCACLRQLCWAVWCHNGRTIGNKSVQIQLAQCWFPGLAISNAKIYIYMLNGKYTEAIFYQIALGNCCEITEKLIVMFIYTLSSPMPHASLGCCGSTEWRRFSWNSGIRTASGLNLSDL